MSHSEFKMVIMLLIIFSLLGIFGVAEVIKAILDKIKNRKRSTRLYQGQL